MKITIGSTIRFEDLKAAKKIQNGSITHHDEKVKIKEQEKAIIDYLQSLCYSVIKIEDAEVVYNRGNFSNYDYHNCNMTLFVTAILELQRNVIHRVSFDLIDLIMQSKGWDDISHYIH